ncbi:MAG: hexitol phosphatase HxpB [Bacteroidetes bacterium]|nr:hexitol phosphatase HxpB [Bacteroidota bacterium]
MNAGPAVKAVIFDMDGTLFDSEPLWQIAEFEVFSTVGVTLTTEMMHSTIGLRIDEVIAYWFTQFPWTGKSQEQIHDEIVDRVIGLVQERGSLLPGVVDALAQVRASGLRIALASASPMRMIEALVTHFGIRDAFEILRSGADDSHGKPHPAVYIRTAGDLGIPTVECLAVEDSFNGLLAAKAARMKCLLVPSVGGLHDPRWGIADQVLENLTEFKLVDWG